MTKRREKAESVPRRQAFIVFQAGFLSVSSSSSSSSSSTKRERERESFFVFLCGNLIQKKRGWTKNTREKRGKREFFYAIKSHVYNGGGNDDKLLYTLEPSWSWSSCSYSSFHPRVRLQLQSVLTRVSSTVYFVQLRIWYERLKNEKLHREHARTHYE